MDWPCEGLARSPISVGRLYDMTGTLALSTQGGLPVPIDESGLMKQVRKKFDLALFGAPPAFDQPVHVGRPNVGDRADFLRQVDAMFDRLWLSNNGPIVQEFEAALAQYMGVRHCISMCNATIALEVAIRGLGLTGEVIVPSYTFIATAHALNWLGLTPVFADIDPRTHNLDPESVRRKITPRTSGIIGVHLWGRAAPVEELTAIAREHNLKLMFDAAHAFGCSVGSRMIGGFGACEVFSFHATKFFNTFEGGAVVTNDDALAEKVRLMRNFGFAGFDNVTEPGTNGKMTEVCAAMGLTNLRNVARVVARNRENYHCYVRELNAIRGLSVLAYDERELNNFQYIVVEVASTFPVSRDEIVAALHAENILARKYFWPGCHAMLPYRQSQPGAVRDLPHTVLVADRVIVLPTGTAVDERHIGVIRDVFACLASYAAKNTASDERRIADPVDVLTHV